MAERQLNHYSVFAFTEEYWEQDREERREFLTRMVEEARELGERVYTYTIFPARPEVDFMLWSAVIAEQPEVASQFFLRYAKVTAGWREFVRPVNTLWGFTRPSIYAPGKSEQELSPFDESRRPYLIVYPFVKTAEWYLMSKDARQGMMNEHIKVGRQYPQITQLLLYSFGLQDQEFVVVYEADDLAQFSDLVNALRATQARVYTLRDTPIYTALYQPAEQFIETWG
ncbi:MAG: chlorite dismutase family protein [Armatimonadota bacterium]|nr:chlorite dismutase family protein [bacterium]MCS7308590.1 chlorite dismutase family protein [Armatimonadota bacterium]MDW8289764.1 chlorite dismutase family protein [Armatimonadota bacterium]